MAFGGVEEHRKVGRLLIIAFLVFSSCNHIVKTVRLPSAGDRGALDNLSVNFNTFVLSPLDHFRLGMGEAITSFGQVCPDALQSTCDATTSGIRLVTGLH